MNSSERLGIVHECTETGEWTHVQCVPDQWTAVQIAEQLNTVQAAIGDRVFICTLEQWTAVQGEGGW